jgi:predicted phage baseplate assembly protein
MTGEVVANAAGQPAVSWRAAPYAVSLRRMQDTLAGSDRIAVRALARHGPDEPAIALLDTWALVADTVSFYTERIVNEGFLRTATELTSVRELARAVGYELRPGVAAQALLSFTVEDAADALPAVTVPAATPVQTVPAAGQLPQTFETATDLEARAAWNAIPAAAGEPQAIAALGPIWIRGTGLGLRPGDHLLAVGAERRSYGEGKGPDLKQWLFRTITEVAENPDGLTGWTRLACPPPPGSSDAILTPKQDVEVVAFTQRAALFGWNAPDAATLLDVPAGQEWPGFGVLVDDSIEIDGEQPRLLPGSWLVLQGPSGSRPYLATTVTPSGAARYGLSGRITRVQPDITDDLGPSTSSGPLVAAPGPDDGDGDDTAPALFTRRTTVVHAPAVPLTAAQAPRLEPVTGATIDLAATDPPLPAGRAVLVSGARYGTGEAVIESSTVAACVLSADGALMTVTLDPPLAGIYAPQGLTVLGNVVTASHGETITQVLGSGDGRAAFAQFQPRRAPLTYVRAVTPDGAASTLHLQVDGVEWAQVPSLDVATAGERVYALKGEDGGAVRIVIGDGTHGARLTTGVENVTATYRVGIGVDGAASASQLSLLTRRPLGIRSVTNPAAASDWAPPESLDDARRNAPLRTRTLDRAVSVIDHEDFAAAYAGVGQARADAVWDGHRQIVVVSVLGTGATAVSDGLLRDLRATLDAARDTGQALAVLGGDLAWFGVRVGLLTDPAYLRADVEQAVAAALGERLGHAARAFATPVTAAEVLVAVHAVAGVMACTMPRLVPLPDPPGTPPLPRGRAADTGLLPARPARFEDATVRPAQLLGLAPDGIEIGVMAS